MARLDRLGMTLLAGGLGIGVLNLATWALGRGMGPWRPALSGALIAAGLAALAVGLVRALREEAEE